MIGQTETLSLKVLRRDKAALRLLAAAEGETMSVIVRRLIREEVRRHGLWPPAGQEQTHGQANRMGEQ